MNRVNLIILLCVIFAVILTVEGNIAVRTGSRAISLILPVLSGMVLLLSLGLFVCETGWDKLIWAYLALLSGAAFAGALLGRLVGGLARREKERD